MMYIKGVLFLINAYIFKIVYLCDHYELEGLPHHSSDVFFHGESIFDRFTSVWELYPSIWVVECHHTPTTLWRIFENTVDFLWFSLIFHRFPLNFIDFHWITATLRSTLETLWSCNRLIEYSNTRKSNGNGFSMGKIRQSCGVEVLPTRNSRKDIPFWK